MVDEKKRPAPAMARVHPDNILITPQSNSAVPEPEAAAPEETATGIVASGKSVHVCTGEKIACGYDALLGRTVFRQGFAVAGPGEVVTLPKSEVVQLMAAGFLINPENRIADDTTTH
jgi:hypothetical protein